MDEVEPAVNHEVDDLASRAEPGAGLSVLTVVGGDVVHDAGVARAD
jgi:hypothetical protein